MSTKEKHHKWESKSNCSTIHTTDKIRISCQDDGIFRFPLHPVYRSIRLIPTCTSQEGREILELLDPKTRTSVASNWSEPNEYPDTLNRETPLNNPSSHASVHTIHKFPRSFLPLASVHRDIDSYTLPTAFFPSFLGLSQDIISVLFRAHTYIHYFGLYLRTQSIS